MNRNWPKWAAAAVVLVSLAALTALSARSGAAAGTDGQASAAAQSQAGQHKQLWHCGMHPQVVQDHPGECPICHMALTPMNLGNSAGSPKGGKQLWWDPMLGPSSITDHPGKSAMGMEMVPYTASATGDTGVQIDPTVVQNMGVRTAPVTRGPLSKTVRAVGLLKIPEPGMHDVSLKVGGWIDKLYADQDGMHVTDGEPLFELYSQDLQVAEQELISAVKALKALPPDASPNLRGEAQGLIDSAKRKLRLWDIAEQDVEAIAKAEQPPKDVPFRSPATGHIEDKMVVQGSAVQPMMKLMRVADHTKMWLDAQVYQEQIPVVKMGQEVIATVDGMPGQTWKGAITFIYPHVDHMTRTLTVRMTLDNPDFALKPGMYATAQIVTRPIADAVQVPREAVIDTGTRQIAFVAEGEGHFSPRKVRMGLAGDDDRAQILDGLAPGETVVTSGQFLMDVESRTIEATQKLRAPIAGEDRTATQPAAPPQPSPATQTAMAQPTMPPMAEMAAATPTQSATQPVMKQELSLTYCPMAKASWLQHGDVIANPYMGQAMSTCGTVQKKLTMPPGSPLSAVVPAYVDVEKALNADRLDAGALASLRAAADKLPAARYGALRDTAGKLAGANELPAARDAFHAFSDQLIAALEKQAQ